MNFGKKKFFAFTLAVVMSFCFLSAVPGFQQEAQAATVVEQRLQEYMNANPVGGAAYNCMAFAKQVFKYVFGYEATGIDYHGNYRSDCSMAVSGRIANEGCGQLQGTTSANVSVESLKALIAQAQPGDILQAMTGGHGKHTMVLVSADDNGISVYHGNWNGKIAFHTFTYEEFAGRWSHSVTVYHANNYDYINNPLNATPVNVGLTVQGGEKVAPRAYQIDGVNYFSLRDVAYLLKDTPLKFNVSTEGGLTLLLGEDLELNGTEMTAGDGSKKHAKAGAGTLNVDDQVLESNYYVIDDNVYIPIRELAKAVNFSVEWNNAEQCVEVSFIDNMMEKVFEGKGSILLSDAIVEFK